MQTTTKKNSLSGLPRFISIIATWFTVVVVLAWEPVATLIRYA